MKLKKYLISLGADMKKTHISFMPPDMMWDIKKINSRCESFLPEKYIIYTEKPYNENSRKKQRVFNNHSKCKGASQI